MAESLAGKTVVITGASGRLAQHIAHAFAEAQANLVFVDRRGKPDRITQPGDWHVVDLADEQAVVSLFEKIHSASPSIDVLIHAAGIWDGKPLLETSLQDWNNVMLVNLQTTFLCFREAARHMHASGGCLIGIGSGQGADKGVGQQGAYSASKAGVIRLVEAVAAEFKDAGITAHAIAPSMILYEGMEDQSGVRAEDIAQTCVFLAGANGQALNGQVLRLYGG